MPRLIHVTTFEDPQIADYRSVRDADLRGGGGMAKWGEPTNKLFMAESESVIRRLIKSQRYEVRSLFLSRAVANALNDAIVDLPEAVPVFVGEEDLLRQVTGYRFHGGALAAGVRPGREEIDATRALAGFDTSNRCVLLLAERVTNIDNVGALMRNAAAFGVDAVVLDRGCADLLFRKAIRVSMGSVFEVPWGVTEDLAATIAILRDRGVTIIACENKLERGETVDIGTVAWPHQVAVVVGSERQGVSAEVLAACDRVVEIPVSPRVDSLNLAVAAAIALHEIRSEPRD